MPAKISLNEVSRNMYVIDFIEKRYPKLSTHGLSKLLRVKYNQSIETILHDKKTGKRTRLFIEEAKLRALSDADVVNILSRTHRFFWEAREIDEAIKNKDSKENEYYKFWWDITDPVRFHRIKNGKASSFVSKRSPQKNVDSEYFESFKGSDFDIRNIWYYFVPFIGEEQYFAYKYGPQEFLWKTDDYLWKFLFESFSPDELFFSDVKPYVSGPKEFEYNPCTSSEYNPYMSGEEICRTLLAWKEANDQESINGEIKFGWWYKFSIAAIRLANTENHFRSHNQKFSRKLLDKLFSGENIFTTFCDQIGQKENLRNHLEKYACC